MDGHHHREVAMGVAIKHAMRGAAMGLGLAATILLGACSEDAVEPGLSSCATIGPIAVILDNHLPSGGDHVLTVPPEDVVAGLELVYDIRGDNVGHTHTVTLTTAHFAALRQGDPISVVSSNNGPVGFGHDHTVRLSCP
jgi:hypothetical protein